MRLLCPLLCLSLKVEHRMADKQLPPGLLCKCQADCPAHCSPRACRCSKGPSQHMHVARSQTLRVRGCVTTAGTAYLLMPACNAIAVPQSQVCETT